MATTININNIFTVQECELIQKLMCKPDTESAKVEVNEKYVEDTKFRKGYMLQLFYDEKYKWIFERIYLCIKKINTRIYNFNLSYDLQKVTILKYEKDDFFENHVDESPGWGKNRKLSLVVPLSNPNDYTGGELYSESIKKTFPNTQGSIIIFPSSLDHEVKKINSGERYTLVAWFNEEI